MATLIEVLAQKKKAADDAAAADRKHKQEANEREAAYLKKFREPFLTFLKEEIKPPVVARVTFPTVVSYSNEIARITIAVNKHHTVVEYHLFVKAGYERFESEDNSSYYELLCSVEDPLGKTLIVAKDVDELREKFAEWILTA
jgi:hypothetical protein